MNESFYSPIPETAREDLLRDYRAFLEKRNGTVDATQPYPIREAWLKEADAASVRHQGEVDAGWFSRSYARFDAAGAPSLAPIALLAFVKMNAGEAYGVEVLTKKRHGEAPPPDLFAQVERVLAQEETYHTRILVGATNQFGLPSPTGAWKPPLPLKVIIGTLAHAPKSLFHPILLGAEIGGVFTFNWVLKKLGEVFKDQPQLRELMEARMMEILVDELGHIAFNRLAVGPKGLATAKVLGARVADTNRMTTPEFVALGWNAQTMRAYDRFDLSSLPEEVRRKAFFV